MKLLLEKAYYHWPRAQFLDNPPRTPLPALIAGPTASGFWEPHDPAPRSVSSSYFDLVCPPKMHYTIGVLTVKDSMGVRWSSSNRIFNTWREILLKSPKQCIEIVSPTGGKIDNYPQCGSDRILSLWESFSKSPTSRLLRTSPIVESAVARNEYIIHSIGPVPKSSPSKPKPVSINPYDRMMAVHIRRGDFAKACYDLATWNSTFYSWNLLPFLPDKFVPLPGGAWGRNTKENTEVYVERCLPSLETIVQKARDSKRDYVAAGRICIRVAGMEKYWRWM
ncbi:hypothetical protein D9758_012827 [Tetrapyrgos nigripes]|uniref:Uncharacterized protein n=1 Tax=Tetrapyrgos nigripes TaxID=182062 RepID=A0A8H5FIV6_9AGAR|nr:hypothetical protein D9758_012827 [Tetrapyrgos nigripes]